jgi:phosphatidate cytidylyltransferase
VVVGLLAASPIAGTTALAASVLPVAWLTLCLWRAGDVQVASRRAMLGTLAMTYTGALCTSLVAIGLRSQAAPGAWLDQGRGGLLGLFVMVFFGDTGAYFAGRALGRHKLYEMVSPKKTVEGAIGGLLSSALGGWLTALWLLPMSPGHGVVLGLLCGAVGQVGDLVESLFKRATGTKDSGTLLPGHGGLLDRLDGVLFAAPVVWAWLTLGLA